MKYTLPFLAIVTTALLAGCQSTSTPSTAQAPATTTSADTAALTSPETSPETTEAAEADTLGAPDDASAGTLSAESLNAWPTVKQGSTGNDVKAVQYFLNAHGFSVSVDGIFGSGTAGAVKNFQSKFSGLSVDGVVGPQTWGKLLVKVKKGDEGNAVKAAQTYLGITVDGKFGSGTDAAVKSFQSRSGLAADGVVGPQTWQALIAGTSGGTTPAPSTDRAALAKQVLANSRIRLTHSSSTSNGSPYQTILDTSKGLKATSGCHGNANCGAKTYLDARMLSGMLKMASQYTFEVNSTMGSGEHAATSYHYKGRAFDTDVINGVGVSSSNGSYRSFMATCRANGAVEVLGPGDAGHSTHVHCAW